MNYFCDADIKCPFYLSCDNKSIKCEGLQANMMTRLVFRTEDGEFRKDDKARYMEEYCANNYKDCMLYQTLNQKYE